MRKAQGAWAALVWYGAGTLALGTWLWYSGVSKAEGAVAAGFMGVMPQGFAVDALSNPVVQIVA